MTKKFSISIFSFSRFIFIFGFLLLNVYGFSQNIPTLKFQNDSVLIGDPTPISFVYNHKYNEEVLFADSTFDYSPFEFDRIDIFSTSSKDSISKDSVVYWLSTFELDKIQTLKIPVFVFNNKDSVPIYSNTDSIRLTEVITILSDTLEIKENTDIQEVEIEFNYPIFSIVLGGLLTSCLLLLFIFKKKIILYFKLKNLEKSHLNFINKFDKLLNIFNQIQSKESLEALIICWKSQLEKLKKDPITKLSTKELQTIISEKKILEILKSADGLIFGNLPIENSSVKMIDLKGYIETEYKIIIDNLKNEGN